MINILRQFYVVNGDPHDEGSNFKTFRIRNQIIAARPNFVVFCSMPQSYTWLSETLPPLPMVKTLNFKMTETHVLIVFVRPYFVH